MTSSPEPTAPTEPAAAGQPGPTPPTGWAPPTAWAPPSGPPAPPPGSGWTAPGSGWTAPGPAGPYPGWSAQPAGQAGYSQPPAARRRRWRTAVVAVPALLVVAAASSLITAQVVSGPTPAEKHAGAGTAKTAGDKTTRHATTGVVTSEDGSRWVVKTSKGTAVSVDVGSSTSFGSKHDPSQASAFHLGSTVKVVGPRTGSTVDAKRVTLLPATTPSAGASPSTSGAAG